MQYSSWIGILIGLILIVFSRFISKSRMTRLKRVLGEERINKNPKFWKYYEIIMFLLIAIIGGIIFVFNLLTLF